MDPDAKIATSGDRPGRVAIPDSSIHHAVPKDMGGRRRETTAEERVISIKQLANGNFGSCRKIEREVVRHEMQHSILLRLG